MVTTAERKTVNMGKPIDMIAVYPVACAALLPVALLANTMCWMITNQLSSVGTVLTSVALGAVMPSLALCTRANIKIAQVLLLLGVTLTACYVGLSSK